MYSVKEIFYTLQGEGAHTGRAAVFCRFAGCNLWSGREADRGAAVCRFCDTDFADTNGPGGGKFTLAADLAAAIAEKWPANPQRKRPAYPQTSSIAFATSARDDKRLRKFAVCTGGEPLLQMDGLLIDALHAHGFEIAVETNGTIVAPEGLDWICVSPKAGAELRQRTGDELKLVYPQADADPAAFESLAFRHFFLQPMDGPQREANTQAALEYCLEHPRWRLSLQTHKLLGIP
jgi:7-carboxy-7-deazaguanine synthase (Cx14CxxC type)